MAPERGSKRKSSSQDSNSKVKKAKPHSVDSSENGSKGSNHAKDIVKKLLSNEIGQLAFPDILPGHGEIDWPSGEKKKRPPTSGSGKTKGKTNDKKQGNTRNYTSPDLSPFEQLVCAVLLSKPISHKLGLRAIQTLLSPPFSLTSPGAMIDAGNEGRREALWEARTQHKEKTAAQLGNLVEGLRKVTGKVDEEGEADLAPVRDQARKSSSHGEAIDKVRHLLTTNIKGLGPTGVDIFLRQVQKQPGWECVFPFVDERGLRLAIRYGLVEEKKQAEEGAKVLAELVNEDPVQFVKLLDVLIGLDLEKKTDETVKQIC